LGAGITGLSAGINLKANIYEATSRPGGICASYYVDLEGKRFYSRKKEETYRFEIGGGHWIWGMGPFILNFINRLSSIKSYQRNVAVYFPEENLFIPYPLQNHLSYLPKNIGRRVVNEIMKPEERNPETLADWLKIKFGKTLCELFFFPFHELYTAGLYTKIAPQDRFKTPVDKNLIIEGTTKETPVAGYNTTFVYPEKGLDDLIRRMEERCKINYNKKAVKIDIKRREVLFKDGSGIKYKEVISTLPLNKMIEITGIEIDEKPPPYVSVLVISIGAKRGKRCPNYHWLYIPKSKSGFHRVGFYSNVDNSFLPLSSRGDNSRISIYVEKSYRGGSKVIKEEIKKLTKSIIGELQNWKFIDRIEVIDSTWIEVAYAYSYPSSLWREKAIKKLASFHVYQVGRYGLWKLEGKGIVDSIRDGLNVRSRNEK